MRIEEETWELSARWVGMAGGEGERLTCYCDDLLLGL